MNKGIVRLGDYCGEAIPHFCIRGSNNVFVNGRPACRKGGILTIGETVTQGSNNVFVNGIGVARTGDVASCSFQIVSKNQSVFSK